MRILRVFPRKTKATPDDDWARIGVGPGLFDEGDEVHVSVTFTWDIPAAERLAEMWRAVAPVKLDGPALGEPGGEFVPGAYLKPGYVITSRGCPNRCWFCSVWKREGQAVRELPILDGWNVLDDNLLACSEPHIRGVFDMLNRQDHSVEFTGGLEAARLEPWMAQELRKVKKLKQMFFAYDTPDDLAPLRQAGRILREAGFKSHPSSHALRCYVLCGFPHDTQEDAETRMRETMSAGFTPMAMVWRGQDGEKSRDWQRFQRSWARPAIIYSIRESNYA